MRYLIATFLFVSLAACGSKDNESYDMPAIEVSCSALDVQECGYAPSDTTVIVGLTKASSSCLHTLTIPNRRWVREDFDYSTEVEMTDQGNYLYAVASDWVTYAFTRATRLEPGDYTLCAFIDFNGNGYLDRGEFYSEDDYSPAKSYRSVKKWYYY